MPALVKALTVASTKTAGTANVNVVVPAGGVAAGNTIIVFVAMDNSAAGTPTITSIARPAGETAAWVTVGNGNTIATLGAGVRTVMMSIKTTVAWPAGNYLVTLSGSTPAKVTAGWEWSGLTGATRSVGLQHNQSSGALSVSMFTSGQVAGDVLIALGGWENNTPGPDDTDTLNGVWEPGLTAATSGGSANTNVALRAQYKILTAATSTQTWNSTGTSDASAVIATFIPEASGPPAGGATGTIAFGAAVAGGTTPALPTLYSPIAGYAFDEGSGIAARESTDVYDIAVSGTDPWEAVGKNGSAFRFTAAETGVGPALPLGNEYSVGFWVRTDGISTAKIVTLIESIGAGFSVTVEMRLIGGNPTYIISLTAGGVTRAITTSLAAWNHFVLTVAADGILRVYRNGVFNSQTASPGTGTDWTQGFRIGVNGHTTDPWLLDDLRFYPNAISQYQTSLDQNTSPVAMPPVLPPAAPQGGATGTYSWGAAVAAGRSVGKGAASGTLAFGPATASGRVTRRGGATGTFSWGAAVVTGKAVRRGGAVGTFTFGPATAAGRVARRGGAVGTLAFGPAVVNGVKPAIPIPLGGATGTLAFGPAAAVGKSIQRGGATAAFNFGPAVVSGETPVVTVPTGGATGTLSWGPATASGRARPKGAASGTLSWGPAVAAGKVARRGGATGTLSFGPATAAGRVTRRGGATGTLSFGPATVVGKSVRRGGASSSYAFGPAQVTARRVSRGGLVAGAYGWGPATWDGDSPTGGSFADDGFTYGPATATGRRRSAGTAASGYSFGPGVVSGGADAEGRAAGTLTFGPSEVGGIRRSVGGVDSDGLNWGPCVVGGEASAVGGFAASYLFGPAEVDAYGAAPLPPMPEILTLIPSARSIGLSAAVQGLPLQGSTKPLTLSGSTGQLTLRGQEQ